MGEKVYIDVSSLLSSVLDNNINGYRDIEDLRNTDLSSQTGIDALSSKNFEIAIEPRTNASKEFQTDGITITMSLTLNQ